ncbi:DUF4145 domain-containing protein [Aromatoleum bremense]|uniref:DUF4145 domain-containing protein n=1 Tax=Aromatoleum bremense TaxID=76115 RepID=A0ABX1NSU5_9RHOO|nr:DUF4145 domain-containing protein [Aromatoleum bremense]NMG15074.1 DUF4145 domain-containing protein [Aromatoleum bremense]QTQ31441.1 putative protein DUf4145 [Aromatoleum bremense]
MPGIRQPSNFSQLKAHDEQLERLGLLAERYFADDPNTCLLKLRQLAEGMAQSVASRVGIYTSADERQIDLLRRLQDHGIVPREVGGLFHEIRKAGNDANHNLAGEPPVQIHTELSTHGMTWRVGEEVSVEDDAVTPARRTARPDRRQPSTSGSHGQC